MSDTLQLILRSWLSFFHSENFAKHLLKFYLPWYSNKKKKKIKESLNFDGKIEKIYLLDSLIKKIVIFEALKFNTQN